MTLSLITLWVPVIDLCLTCVGGKAEHAGADRGLRRTGGEGTGGANGRRHHRLPAGRPRAQPVRPPHRQGLLQVGHVALL